MTQSQRKEKVATVKPETFIGKRIIVTFPPVEMEVIIEVVPPELADPQKWKLAPNAPIVGVLMTKAPGEEFDLTVGRDSDTTKIRYKLIKVLNREDAP